ncbi:MAG: SpoVR family protein [Patescibacteria group bacterium]
MELISQETKRIMEECKKRAKAFGLNIEGETLEYIVTNRNLTELSSKVMIPTLYDYWADDVDTIRNKWIYEIRPHNPYETVINTRPVISYYNDNNPDWLNTMIFYHVLGHIDFFQNNVFFKKTWLGDFCGEALADKRLLNKIREEMGAKKRWVDYVIEFARSADNLVGYYHELGEDERTQAQSILGMSSERVNFYFGEFLRGLYDNKAIALKFYYDEIERFNSCQKQFGQKQGEIVFFDDPSIKSRFPEFLSAFKKHKDKKKVKSKDILQHLMDHSIFINREENKWMKEVIEVVRRTSLYFQPQIRTKSINEGWASLCHERMFMADPRMSSYETDFARTNSRVVAYPRIGFNPYITYKNLLEFIEGLAEKGKLSREYQLLKDVEARKDFANQTETGAGKSILFEARKSFDDFTLANFLSVDDFQDFVNKYNLFVVGQRLNPEKFTIEYYIKSRNGEEYRKMLNDRLYHPPYLLINEDKAEDGELYLDHVFEGRTLVTKYIPAVLRGIAYLHGDSVKLETTEFDVDEQELQTMSLDPSFLPTYTKLRVLYKCDKRGDVKREVISEEGST